MFTKWWWFGFVFGTLVGLYLVTPAKADELWLTTGEWSRHVHDTNCPWPGAACRPKYRQNNTGIGLEVKQSVDSSVLMGYYHNSVYRETVFGGMTYTPIHYSGVSLGIVGGLATGYTDKFPAVPIGGIFSSLEYKGVGMNIYWLPNVVTAIQFKIRIN